MFQLLFQNLFHIHRQTRLLEIFDWDEENLQNYMHSLSQIVNDFQGDSIDSLMDLCLETSKPFVSEINQIDLKKFFEEEFNLLLEDILSKKNELEN